jgi:hypothetical protein
MGTSKTRSLARPAKDEWGVYDPQQAGLAALFARLDRDHAAGPPVASAPALRTDVPEPTRLSTIPAPPKTRTAR